MSESHPVYIPCASDNNTQADFMIRRKGDLIQMLCHNEMLLTPQDALQASRVLMSMAMDALQLSSHPEGD